MLVIETLQVAVLILTTERQTKTPLLLWTAVGFGTSQTVTALGGGVADAFFRVTTWLAGPAALLSGLLIGWAA
jgi:hypothetical protein